MKERYLAAPVASQAVPMSKRSTPVENPFQDPENPFTDPVKPAAPMQHPASASAPAPIMMPEPVRVAAPLSMPEPTPAFGPLPTPAAASVKKSPSVEDIAIAAASAGTIAARAAAENREGLPLQTDQLPVEMPSPVPIPAPLQTTRSAPVPAPAPAPEGSVYRILMDFIPSMEDELELRAGQVVRLLHIYDDGWVSSPSVFLMQLAN